METSGAEKEAQTNIDGGGQTDDTTAAEEEEITKDDETVVVVEEEEGEGAILVFVEIIYQLHFRDDGRQHTLVNKLEASNVSKN